MSLGGLAYPDEEDQDDQDPWSSPVCVPRPRPQCVVWASLGRCIKKCSGWSGWISALWIWRWCGKAFEAKFLVFVSQHLSACRTSERKIRQRHSLQIWPILKVTFPARQKTELIVKASGFRCFKKVECEHGYYLPLRRCTRQIGKWTRQNQLNQHASEREHKQKVLTSVVGKSR